MTKACQTCGLPFDARGPQRYCSPECRHGTLAGYGQGCRCEACREASHAWHAAYSAAHPEVSREYRASHTEAALERSRRWCVAHPEAAREKWRRWAAAHPEYNRERKRRYSAEENHRRRARLAAVVVEVVDFAEICRRDRWTCGLCHRKVSPTAKARNRRASLDHVIPLSLGGPHTMANVQLAHLACNVRKGARLTAPVQLSLIG